MIGKINAKLKKLLESENILVWLMILMLSLFVSIELIPWIGHGLNFIYKTPQNSNAATMLGAITGAWGSVLGGIVGGVITFFGVKKTIRYSEKQNEGKVKDIEKRERKIFADEVAVLVGRYFTNMNKYYNDYYHKKLIEAKIAKHKKSLNNIFSDKLFIDYVRSEINGLEMRLSGFSCDKSIAEECLFVLQVKLQDVTNSNNLISVLFEIKRIEEKFDEYFGTDDKDLSYDEDAIFQNIEKLGKQLRNVTNRFIYLYVEDKLI